ncbi:hypothetical protein RRG08_018153 [Elysia crispata]|uniref:Uncharacterized protein n=1 Tax=Elysia crispata TaxID=231223 RepID=A0AAE1B0E7_9GAST|nr:hypothetical protein RRG08_018153 [Elysia crispata]
MPLAKPNLLASSTFISYVSEYSIEIGKGSITLKAFVRNNLQYRNRELKYRRKRPTLLISTLCVQDKIVSVTAGTMTAERPGLTLHQNGLIKGRP